MTAAGRLTAAVVLALVLSACRGASNDSPTGAEPQDRPAAAEESGRANDIGDRRVRSALDDPDQPEFPDPLIDLSELVEGVHRRTGSPPSTSHIRGRRRRRLARAGRARPLPHPRRADQGLPDPDHDVARDRQRRLAGAPWR